jgi:hypothetical protein
VISALLFGIPHYVGTPGQLIGVLVASFLGWFLAKSVLETQAWAGPGWSTSCRTSSSSLLSSVRCEASSAGQSRGSAFRLKAVDVSR